MEVVNERTINLRDLLDELPVERVRTILSTFSCPLNADIEDFLVKNAIDFSDQGKAQKYIAQLGKNYARGINVCFEGAKLLKIACSKVAAIQRELSGKLVYVECEDEERLIDFYERNGFKATERAETLEAGNLIQMIRYL